MAECALPLSLGVQPAPVCTLSGMRKLIVFCLEKCKLFLFFIVIYIQCEHRMCVYTRFYIPQKDFHKSSQRHDRAAV